MCLKKSYKVLLVCLVLGLVMVSCHRKKILTKDEIVGSPEDMDQQVGDDIEQVLAFALENNGKIDDSTHLRLTQVVDDFYSGGSYANVWSHDEKWNPLADSLYQFIEQSKLEGLFPNDYHLQHLINLKKKLDTDSTSRTDATLWTRADLMLTDGFMHLVKDLKQGRFIQDSIALNKDSVLSNDFFADRLTQALATGKLTEMLDSLEPTLSGYVQLKQGLKGFLDSMDKRVYTYVDYPIRSDRKEDSLAFIHSLRKRLSENKCIKDTSALPDSVELRTAIKLYQKQKNLKQDGKWSIALVRSLNDNDMERFKRIALTMDKYKMLPDTMPVRYIWVNLPEFYMRVWDHDTVAILSKIVCGKPTTRSPLLNGSITNMVTYPTWTVPTSIIVKQYLPKLKVDPTYLSHLPDHIELHLVDKHGNPVDPKKVNWKKYTKGIPYEIVQGSGDDNALGVLKFNFNNKYSVYLHDTNERRLFNDSIRCLSHGCVRVQQWEPLAFYILKNDSIFVSQKPGGRTKYNADSLVNILARKEKKTIYMYSRLPLFIRYFTCIGEDGKITFYDDMYGEDKFIRDKYFSKSKL
jgi:L,D-transpeptidase YcbB